jgi:hypothetical protein
VEPRSSDENSAIHQSLLEHLHLGLGGRRRTDHQHFDGVTDCAGRLACINHISSTKQILSWRKISISLIDQCLKLSLFGGLAGILITGVLVKIIA